MEANRIKLGLELTRPLEVAAIRNVFTGATPRIGHGRAVQFEAGLFNNGVLLAGLADILSLTLEVKSWTGGAIDTGAALLSQTIAAGAFNAALTADEWSQDSGATPYHAKFVFLDTEIGALVMTGAVANEKAFGLVITGLTAKGRIPCGSGPLVVVQDGGTGAGGGVAPVASYTFSDQEILAMVNDRVKAGVNPFGASYTLPAINDATKGILFYVEVPAGETEPVLRRVTVVIPT